MEETAKPLAKREWLLTDKIIITAFAASYFLAFIIFTPLIAVFLKEPVIFGKEHKTIFYVIYVALFVLPGFGASSLYYLIAKNRKKMFIIFFIISFIWLLYLIVVVAFGKAVLIGLK